MEVCGGQTHAIVRFALDEMLPPQISLIHGPGCPVCVTPLEMIDKAVAVASRREVIFCSFGDMLRVPGSTKNLFAVKSEGGDVRIVYSPMEAVALAQRQPDRQVVFFAVGFETTAPANAMAVAQARAAGTENFSALVSHVLVPPAIAAVLQSPANRVQGFLAAGHVYAITGMDEYHPIARQSTSPSSSPASSRWTSCRVCFCASSNSKAGRAEVVNQYARAFAPKGIRRRCGWSARSSRRWRGSGGASARSRPAAWPCGRNIASSTPSGGSASRGSSPRSRRSALPAWCCRGTQADGLPRLRPFLHAGAAAWRPDGLGGRGLRGVLSVSTRGLRSWVWVFGFGRDKKLRREISRNYRLCFVGEIGGGGVGGCVKKGEFSCAKTEEKSFFAADSIGANIAEGSGRGSNQDYRRFLRIARGSLCETQHWLRRAFRRNLLTPEQVERLKAMVDSLAPAFNA